MASSTSVSASASTHDPTSTAPTTATPTSTTSDAARQAEARLAITQSLRTLGASQTASLTSRASTIHSASLSIAQQERELATATQSLAKESAKLQKVVDKATKGLNGMGDLQNWAECLERDLLVLEETVRLVDEGGREVEGGRGESGTVGVRSV